MTGPVLQRSARNEQFAVDALVARIALDYLEALVRDFLIHRPAAQVQEAVKRRHAPASQRERIGAILRHCAPARCVARGRT
jgi:hypothetical protein